MGCCRATLAAEANVVRRRAAAAANEAEEALCCVDVVCAGAAEADGALPRADIGVVDGGT
jgi:hypothetical protein